MTDLSKTYLPAMESACTSTADLSSITEVVPTTVNWILLAHLQEHAPPQRMPVQNQPFTVGRHSKNTLTVSNGTVSGRHAELILAGNDMLVRDCESTNGTLLNGRRIKDVEVLNDGDILHFGNVMLTVRKDHGQTLDNTAPLEFVSEAIAQVQFDSLLSRPGVEPCFQPIINLVTQQRTGYEVLTRSHMTGLETPAKMFKIAAQRTSEAILSRICRVEGMRAGASLAPDMKLYLNTHPAELNDDALIDSLHDLRERHPLARIVLEVHESAVTSVGYLRTLRAALQSLDMELAYDDFGAGQARLTELIEVPPDILKFDIKLVRGLSSATPAARTTIAGLVRIVKELNVVPLAEGVETQEEARICRDLGFNLAQGFLFGKGEPVQKWIT